MLLWLPILVGILNKHYRCRASEFFNKKSLLMAPTETKHFFIAWFTVVNCIHIILHVCAYSVIQCRMVHSFESVPFTSQSFVHTLVNKYNTNLCPLLSICLSVSRILILYFKMHATMRIKK